jgi:hypothetical protein
MLRRPTLFSPDDAVRDRGSRAASAGIYSWSSEFDSRSGAHEQVHGKGGPQYEHVERSLEETHPLLCLLGNRRHSTRNLATMVDVRLSIVKGRSSEGFSNDDFMTAIRSIDGLRHNSFLFNSFLTLRKGLPALLADTTVRKSVASCEVATCVLNLTIPHATLSAIGTLSPVQLQRDIIYCITIRTDPRSGA